MNNPNVSSAMKKDLETNLDEYLEDPNIVFSEDGKIHYITSTMERKRIMYVPST
jgi:hypothetical protein